MTAGDKPEEGGDDVKSSCPLMTWATRATMDRTKGSKNREVKPIPQICSQFGSQSATRLREAGIASNRGSACRGEYVPGALYTPPVTPREFVTPEVGEVTF